MRFCDTRNKELNLVSVLVEKKARSLQHFCIIGGSCEFVPAVMLICWAKTHVDATEANTEVLQDASKEVGLQLSIE
jgi:hypothetical protein